MENDHSFAAGKDFFSIYRVTPQTLGLGKGLGQSELGGRGGGQKVR